MQQTGDAGACDHKDEQREDAEHNDEEADHARCFAAADAANRVKVLHAGVGGVAREFAESFISGVTS